MLANALEILSVNITFYLESFIYPQNWCLTSERSLPLSLSHINRAFSFSSRFEVQKNETAYLLARWKQNNIHKITLDQQKCLGHKKNNFVVSGILPLSVVTVSGVNEMYLCERRKRTKKQINVNELINALYEGKCWVSQPIKHLLCCRKLVNTLSLVLQSELRPL